MITVRNRTLIVPEGERVIGTDYDNNSEVRQFRVEKAPGGIDISHLAFRLDLMYQGEIYDTCKLEKEEREDSMILAWTVAATNVAHPGTVWISLRAIDDAGTVKWGSNAAALYVQSSVNTPSHASGMTELEEHEKKMEDLLLKSEEAVSRANNATSKAETAIQTTTEAVKTAQTAATSAGSSADLAEAWAHGKKGYTAQTNDNAMYWSEQSKKRAESAKEQADRAKIYADSIAPLMDRGEYSSGTTYQENDLVKYQNAIWRCKIDGTASVPQEGENWTLFFRGVQSINELVAADVQGLLGQEGAKRVNAQALIDAVAEKIATKLLLKSDVVSQLVNDATKAASSAAVYALQQKLGTGDLPNGMSDVVAGLKALNSDLTPSGITDVSHAINTAYGSGNISYHVFGKVCFVYFVFTPSQKCDNVGLLNNGVLPLAKDSVYRSISTWGNPNVAVSLVQTVTTGGLRFWCGESSIGMQIFDSFSYCIK